MASRMPSARSRARLAVARGGSFMIVLSVTSRVEQLAGQAVRREHRADLLDQVAVAQEAGGEVDGDRQRSSLVEPRAALPHGDVQHREGQLGDDPGALGDRDEHVREEQAAGGVLPAHERLDAVQAAGRRDALGLVEDPELVALDAVAQLAEQGQPLRAVRVLQGLVERPSRRAPSSPGRGRRRPGRGSRPRCRRATGRRRRRCWPAPRAARRPGRRSPRAPRAGAARSPGSAAVHVAGGPSSSSMRANSSPPSRAMVRS